MNNSKHYDIINARYADKAANKFTQYPTDMLVDRYLGKLMSPADFSRKSVLEIGAGCSHYGRVFLDNGCNIYYANDLIPERLAASRIEDVRYNELPGNFLEIDVPQRVDFVFACLTMMFVMPMLDAFIDKIYKSLESGGHFISMDPNHLCPLSLYRHFADPSPNPVKLFSPFSYAESFRKKGFEVERLLPLTGKVSWATGSWVLGTTFWLKVRKK